MAHGHPEARKYPLAMLLDEFCLVIERLNAAEVTRATLLQSAISSVLSKKGGKVFDKTVKNLNIRTVARKTET